MILALGSAGVLLASFCFSCLRRARPSVPVAG
jgi:hypothetical protein